MPKRTDLRVDPHHRQRPDRHRAGVRVRLLGHAGVPRAARRGLPRRARELEPGDDHDRPRVRRRHLRRAARPRQPHPHHRAGAPRRAAPHARRPDRAEPRDRAARGRCARAVRRRADRRERRGDPHRREPPRVQGGDGGDRPRGAALGVRVHARGGAWRSPSRSATRSSCGRRSSSAAAAPAWRRTPTRCARVAEHGLATSPVSEILIEQSVAGWKEFELEVMRDHADNVVVVCSIENFDAMGVHTGDSITVAPAQTLTDVEYQRMRDAAFACIRRIGVDTGGSNIQFALNPAERRHGRHRDEPARVAQQRAREQGDRVPDREDRGAARGRLPARRDHERHHRRDARVVRAHHRLRRHQGAALGVREAARARRRCSAR